MTARTTEPLLRELAPVVLGIVVRRFGDFSAAEDAVQEALAAAAMQWPCEGLPENPCAWLIHVATRRMTDALRSELARRRRETELALEMPVSDDRLDTGEAEEHEIRYHDEICYAFMQACGLVDDHVAGCFRAR